MTRYEELKAELRSLRFHSDHQIAELAMEAIEMLAAQKGDVTPLLVLLHIRMAQYNERMLAKLKESLRLRQGPPVDRGPIDLRR